MRKKKEKEEKEEKGIFGKGITDQIIILTIIVCLSGLAVSFKTTVINFYITDVLHLGLTYTALRLSLGTILILLPIIFGTLSDNTRSRYGRRRPFFLLGIFGGFAMLLFILYPNFISVLFIDLALISVPLVAFTVAKDVIIPDTIESKIRGRVNGFISAVNSAVGILPEVTYLMMYEFFSETQVDQSRVFYPEAIIFLLVLGGIFMIISSLLGFYFIKEPKLSEMPPKKKIINELKSTFQVKELRKHKDFFIFTLGFIVYSLASMMIGSYLMYYIRSLGVPGILLVIALIGLGPIGVILVLLGGYAADKYGRKPLIAPLLILGSIGCILISFAGRGDSINFVMLISGILLTLQGTATIDMPFLAWRQDLLEPEKRGQFNSLVGLIKGLTSIPALFLITFIADTFGIQWMFIGAPIFYVASLPFFLKVKETLKVEEDNKNSNTIINNNV